MVITGAFLAESAASVDNKLHVWGGVIANYTVGDSREFQLALVLLTRRDDDSPDRTARIDVVPPGGGDAMSLTFDVPRSTAGADVGFAYTVVSGVFPYDGTYLFNVSSGGTSSIEIPLTVDHLEPVQ